MLNRFLTCLMLAAVPAAAQLSQTDYDRARAQVNTWRPLMKRFADDFRWTNDGAAVWFTTGRGAKIQVIRVDVETGERRVGKQPSDVGIPDAEADAGADRSRGQRRGQSQGQNQRRGRRANRRGPRNAFVRDDNVWIRVEGSERQLTKDGVPGHGYRRDIYVSPNKQTLLAFRQKDVPTREVTLVASAPKEQLQPKTRTLAYRKPGDELPQPMPVLIDIASGETREVDPKRFENSYQLRNIRWSKDGSEVFVLYNRRGHQQLALYAIHAETGVVRTVVEERSETFVDYSQKTVMHWLEDSGELLWTSERSGHNHLYLVDVKTGELAPITSGDWVFRRLEHVDAERRQVWFTAFGLAPDQDHYHAHLARVNFDGTDLQLLTAADGNHTWQFSPDRKHFVTRWSRVDHPTVAELRRSRDGKLIAELGRDDASELLEAGYAYPERFVAKGRDGQTDIYGFIIRPSNYDSKKRYPVIEAIYAGPHDFHVPKSFIGTRYRELAELGFVVVKIDGMGTNWRSKAFHDVCWRNLKDAGFPDRIAWMKAANAKYPHIDISRVGIYGGSAGGQNAMAAMLWHGDFYAAAAADCGCHDNRMDKIWWNEAWMGYPVGDWYAESSNVEYAHRLKGALFLTVGEMDTNVDPSSTYQVVDALIKADKDFEFYMIPGGGHGAGGGRFGAKRRTRFFVKHLRPGSSD